MQLDNFKFRVHDVYKNAISSSTFWHSFSDTKDYIFRDVSVYGFDSGYDFAKSNINEISSEIIKAAKSRQQEISFHPYKFGEAALEGMAKALSDLLKMKITLSEKSVTITWAENGTNLV